MGRLERLTCLCCGQTTWADREGSAGPDLSTSSLKPLVVYRSLPPSKFVSVPSLSFPLDRHLLSCHSQRLCYCPGCEGLQLGWGRNSWRQREGGQRKQEMRRTDQRCTLCFPQDIAGTRTKPETQTEDEIDSILQDLMGFYKHTYSISIFMTKLKYNK